MFHLGAQCFSVSQNQHGASLHNKWKEHTGFKEVVFVEQESEN